MNSEVTKKTVPTLYGSIKAVPQVDNTLTKEGCYADAKAVGDILRGEQRAVNFSYDSNGNGLEATTIQEALDELNELTKGKAPLGYVEAVYEVSTLADFNAKIVELEGAMDVKTIKRYAITKGTWDDTFPSADYFVEIRKAWHGYSTVTARAVCNGNQIVLHRALDNNAWRDWEWENPLMTAGVEYRTTERWLDKAVYTQIISIPWAVGTVHTIANFEGNTPHKYFGKVGTWAIQFMYNGTINGNYSAVVTLHKNNADLKIGMYGGSSISGTLELQLWYTKE